MEIVPVLDPALTVRYPDVETIVSGSQSQAKKLLDSLWESGALKRKFFDKILVCPTCFSANVSSDYVCSSCSSLEIEKKPLVEHAACGAIDILDSFSIDGRLYCPSCQREVTESAVTAHKQGSCFFCLQCRVKSNSPRLMHRCRNCEHLFTVSQTQLVSLYSFRLDSGVEEEFKQTYFVMKPIGMVLEELLFRVEMPGQIVGRSGTLHRFDVIATGSSAETVVIDVVASTEPITEVSVASLYAKIFDLSEVRPILVAIPSISEKAGKLASLYQVWVIEAKTSERAAEELKAGFRWMGLNRAEDVSSDLQM